MDSATVGFIAGVVIGAVVMFAVLLVWALWTMPDDLDEPQGSEMGNFQ